MYHMHASRVQRSKGQNACASYAYISGERVEGERVKKVYDYARKERVEYTQMLLPEGSQQAFASGQEMVNSIENFEKSKNAQPMIKVEVALPKVFSKEQQKETIENFLQKEFVSKGFPCVYAVHTDPEQNNPHAHCMVANRRLLNGAWEKVKEKKVYALDEAGERIPVLDENGEQVIGKNGRRMWKRTTVSQSGALDSKEDLKALRTAWADQCNKSLTEDLKITEKSYKDQGLEDLGLKPQKHEGPAIREMQSRGIESEIGKYNKEVKEHNNIIRKILETLKKLRDEVVKLGKREQAATTIADFFRGLQSFGQSASNTELAGNNPANAGREQQSAGTSEKTAEGTLTDAEREAIAVLRADGERRNREAEQRRAEELRRKQEEARKRKEQLRKAKNGLEEGPGLSKDSYERGFGGPHM